MTDAAEELLSGLRAAAEITRLRILFALSHGELNVSELTSVLQQSQPRVSRHLKVLGDAGLISRHKEGNWVLFRLREDGLGSRLARSLVDMLPGGNDSLADDVQRFEAVRKARAELAQQYFASNAKDWERLRALHVEEKDVEAAALSLVGSEEVGTLVDLGTGTGRMLEVFHSQARNLIGLDLSHEMLAIARLMIEEKGIKNAQIRRADIYALPLADTTADLVLVHQVLHFLDDPQKALAEGHRVLKNGGRILIVDFAPHDLEEVRELHAHRRLGISTSQMQSWLDRAGFKLEHHTVLPPPWPKSGKGLTVSLWLATANKGTQSKERLVA